MYGLKIDATRAEFSDFCNFYVHLDEQGKIWSFSVMHSMSIHPKNSGFTVLYSKTKDQCFLIFFFERTQKDSVK